MPLQQLQIREPKTISFTSSETVVHSSMKNVCLYMFMFWVSGNVWYADGVSWQDIYLTNRVWLQKCSGVIIFAAIHDKNCLKFHPDFFTPCLTLRCFIITHSYLLRCSSWHQTLPLSSHLRSTNMFYIIVTLSAEGNTRFNVTLM